MTPVANLLPVSTTLAAKLSPVSTTPVANMPPVSTTLAANFATSFSSVNDTGGKFAAGVNDTGGNQWDQYQAEDTLKWTWRQKFYIYVNSTIQRCPNKIIKIFLIEDFFQLPPVAATPVVNLELWISPRIWEKIQNGPNGILWGWGETDS